MTNSDNKHGVFNKKTKIISQSCIETTHNDGNGKIETLPAPAETVFASVDEAKSFIFTDEALAVINECATQLDWALVDSDKKLKVTYAFGTKGGNISAADDWAGQYNSRKTALIDSNTWFKGYVGKGFLAADSEEHLF